MKRSSSIADAFAVDFPAVAAVMANWGSDEFSGNAGDVVQYTSPSRRLRVSVTVHSSATLSRLAVRRLPGGDVLVECPLRSDDDDLIAAVLDVLVDHQVVQ